MLGDIKLLLYRSVSRGFHGTLGAFKLRLMMLEHASILKIANLVIVKTQKRFKCESLRGSPYRYKIDPTNYCSIGCPLCPTGLEIPFRKKGHMGLEQFKNIVDQISTKALVIDLYGWGDPFINPEIFQIIKYAAEKKIFVRTSSSLDSLSTDNIGKIIESGLDALTVPVDGVDNETHSKYRSHSNLQYVLRVVKEIVEQKRLINSSTPHVTIQMMVTRYNEDQISEVRELASNIGVDAFSVVPIAVNPTDCEMIEKLVPVESKVTTYGSILENSPGCSDLWEALVINWDGGLSPCFWEYGKDNDLANCVDTPIAEIWNSDSFKIARRIVAGKEIDSGSENHTCNRCKKKPKYLKSAITS
jgi:radical SAM protein with 4Fe4S-binding SPASM domain